MGGFSPRGNPFRAYPKRVCSCLFQRQELRKHSWVGLLSCAQRRSENCFPFLGLVNLGLSALRPQAPSFREGWLTCPPGLPVASSRCSAGCPEIARATRIQAWSGLCTDLSCFWIDGSLRGCPIELRRISGLVHGMCSHRARIRHSHGADLCGCAETAHGTHQLFPAR